MKVSVVISTYNNPEWFKKGLWGYMYPDYKNFKIVIADDDSKKSTFTLIERFQKKTNLKIKHIWHGDDEFRKTMILSKATLEATGDYIIFTDGDYVPRRDYIAMHVKYIERGRFLSGGYCNTPMEYGGENREIGDRLFNLGLKSSQIRHRAVFRHLDHTRSSISEECLQRNKEIREETVALEKTWTGRGIVKGEKQ